MSLFKRLAIYCCLLFLTACPATQTKKAETNTKPVNEDFYPTFDIRVAKDLPHHQFKIELSSGSERIDTELLNMIYSLVINKSFLSSQIFPEGSLFRKKVHSFSLDESSNAKNIIKAELTKDDRFASYKLVIEKNNPNKKDEKVRQWLFSSELTKEQAAIRIARTLVKYSFQEL